MAIGATEFAGAAIVILSVGLLIGAEVITDLLVEAEVCRVKESYGVSTIEELVTVTEPARLTEGSGL